ncbi:MAG: redoxin domain-containing protein [Nevskiaceae bacterium]|nr:MAG: redoxin domain-containing protein [Nevskiaceae bacterium]
MTSSLFRALRLLVAGTWLLALTAPPVGAEDTAPEIAQPGLQWFNVAAPVPMASLRGRIVVLDFWTEGCINCIHIIPILRDIETRYPDRVAVIGVHSPKFAREKSATSVSDAIRRYEIHHPVIHDPEMRLWQVYGVEAWPTLVIIGADGKVLGQVQGEPDPERFRQSIADLVERSAAQLKPARLALQPLPAPSGRFSFPAKLKPVPGAVRRWVLADAGHNQIVLLDDRGNDLRRFGDGTAGLVDGASGRARFNHPQGLIASSDAIFVADTGNHAIRRIDLASGAVSILAGTGQRGHGLGAAQPALKTALASPWDLELKTQQLYFANAGTHQIGVLSLADGKVSALAGSGAEALTDGGAEEAGFAQPSGLAMSADGGTLYVADAESSAIRAIALRAPVRVKTLVGAGLFDFGRVDGGFSSARLQHPLGVAVAEEGLLVADTYNSTIRALDLQRRTVGEFDGGGFTCVDPVCIPTREPAGIVADGRDRVLLVDTGNQRIEEYRPSAKTYRTWAR